MALDLANVTAALRDWYSPLRIANMFLKGRTFSMLPKVTNFEGLKFVHPIQSALGSGMSASASVAFSSSSAASPRFQRWEVDSTRAFCGRLVEGQVIDRTKSSQGSWLRAITTVTDDAYQEFVQNTSISLWGTGSGSLGQIAAGSDVSTTQITLTNVADARKFRIGQILQGDLVDGGGTVNAGTATLTKVDPNTGVLTASAAWTSITGAAVGMYLFGQGNYDSVFAGIPAWIPTVAKRDAGILSTTFNNVDRSINPLVLAGHAIAGHGAPKITTIERLGVQISSTGGTPDICVVSFDDYSDILESLGTRAMIVDQAAYKMPQVSFPAVQLATSFGPVKIFADQFVPSNDFWMLSSKTWQFLSMGAYPYTKMHDGLSLRAIEAADSYGYRIIGDGLLYCSSPFDNGTGQFADV